MGEAIPIASANNGRQIQKLICFFVLLTRRAVKTHPVLVCFVAGKQAAQGAPPDRVFYDFALYGAGGYLADIPPQYEAAGFGVVVYSIAAKRFNICAGVLVEHTDAAFLIGGGEFVILDAGCVCHVLFPCVVDQSARFSECNTLRLQARFQL